MGSSEVNSWTGKKTRNGDQSFACWNSPHVLSLCGLDYVLLDNTDIGYDDTGTG
jgi:hypothetical protein